MAEELKIKISAETNDAEKNIKNVKDEVEELGEKGSGTGEKLKSAFSTIGSTIAGAMVTVGSALATGAAALTGLAESTREYRTEQAKLDAAFQTAGGTAETATQTYNDLYRVLGDGGQATEAAAHLAQLTTSQEDLATWTETCQGVYATFGDSLPIESLTEAANETSKTGQLTGALADALNWAGISEDDFQAKLDACNTEAEREQLIRETLNSTYSDAAAAYEESAGSIMDANLAQAKLNETMGALGGAAEPVVTMFKSTLADALSGVVPHLDTVSQGLQDIMNGTDGGAEKLAEGVSGMMNSITTSITELLPTLIETGVTIVTSLLEGILQALPGLITAIAEAIPPLLQGIVDAFVLIVEYLPGIIEAIVAALPDLIPALIDGIVTMLVTLCENIVDIIQPIIDALPEIIISIVTALMDNLPALIQGLITLILEIVKAIPEIIQALIEALPTVISSIITGLLGCIPQLIGGFIQVIAGVVLALPEIFASLVEGIGGIFVGIWNGIVETFASVGEWFGDIFGDAWEAITGVFSGAGEWFSGIWENICNAFSAVGTWFSDLFQGAWDSICGIWEGASTWFNDTIIEPVKNFFGDMWEGLKNGASKAWEGITGIFSSVASFFGDIFGKAWEAVKGVFSAGGKIFDGIKEGIVATFKTVVNAIIKGINKVVRLPFDGLNGILNTIQGISVAGIKPFNWLSWRAPIPQLPELATGGVVDEATHAIVGEDGAEAVMPLENNLQWLDKLANMLSERMGGNTPIVLQVDGKTFAQISVDSINQLTKQTGSLPLVIA